MMSATVVEHHAQPVDVEAATGEADAVTTEVIRNRLVSAAELMRITLSRTAFSPIVFEAIDFCCALYDRRIRLLAQGRSLPIWLGTMNYCVEAAVDAVGGEDKLEPGDVLLHTGAYETGSHAQDVALVVPAFLDRRLVGYATIKAHHMDLGAKHPYNTDTEDYFQEGVIFPGVKMYRAGNLQEDIYRIALANSRLPDALDGDLHAHIGAARLGADELARIIGKYSHEQFGSCTSRMFEDAEELTRRRLEKFPDGRYSAQGSLDSDGVVDEMVPFEVAVEVEGDNVVVDFTSSPAQRGGPINTPFQTTVSTARFAIASVTARHEAVNEGTFRPITVRTTPGTLFHPRPPAPIFLYYQPAMVAIELLHKALSEAVPDEVVASSGGDLSLITCWREGDDGRFAAQAQDHATGQGATAHGDGGAPLMHISCSGGRNTPAEIWEHAFPLLLVERYELAPDSAGAGKYRGGLGYDMHYRALEDIRHTVAIERTKTPPWGLAGGAEGRPNSVRVRHTNGQVEGKGKVAGGVLPRGSVLEVCLGGGGGHGNPAERAVDQVLEDVRQGYLSEDSARRLYPHAFSQGSQGVGQ